MKNEKKEPKSIGPMTTQLVGLQVGLVSLADPTHIFYNIFNYNNIIIYYNIIDLKNKKSQKIPKDISKYF